jgi:hypothetical protein
MNGQNTSSTQKNILRVRQSTTDKSHAASFQANRPDAENINPNNGLSVSKNLNNRSGSHGAANQLTTTAATKTSESVP